MRPLVVLAVALPHLTGTVGAQAPDPAVSPVGASFEAMLADPGNLDLMFAHAAEALAANDIEGAISTLERMLIFNPDLSRVKLELGAAYYRLGAYDVARTYFEAVMAANPPESVQATVAPFLAEIDRRTARSGFSGFVSLGAVYSTNANLGPQDREVRVNAPGFNGVGLLDPSATASDSFGTRFSAGITHRLDLERPNEDAWITSASYSGLRFASESLGEFDIVDVATGPRLSIDDRQFGSTVRPLVFGGFVRSNNQPLYVHGGAGAELVSPLDESLTAFGTAIASWRDYNDEDSFDGFYAQLSGALGYAVDRDTVLRGGLFVETDRTREEYTSNVSLGLRASMDHTVRAAAFSFLAAPPIVSLAGQISSRWFDDPDPMVDPGVTRRDLDLRVGTRLVAPVSSRVGIALDAAYFERFSNIVNYDLENFEVGVSVLFSF